jgi:hypothetical protein
MLRVIIGLTKEASRKYKILINSMLRVINGLTKEASRK